MSRSGTACRVCGQRLPAVPVLAYRNMPDAAQHFPDASQLAGATGRDLDVFECAGCGLLQLASAPVDYYREVIRAAAFSAEMREFRLAQLADWISRHALGGKRMLEIGCGKGEYLELLASCGVEASGLEYATDAVRHCRQQGLRAQRGFLQRPGQRLAGAPYDGFMALNFMEHWPRPVATLQTIGNNLADHAIGLVEVPDTDMILREGMYSEFIRDHLSYFTRETLAFTLQRAGFEVLAMESVWHDYILSATVRKRPAKDMATLTGRQAALGADIQAFIRRFPARSVAVWGAGHQALAAIALSEAGPSLRYVVDSAPFKQGRYTPASHLPIVPPATLRSDPVHAIIVMAASYSDEVARQIRLDMGLDIPVAILRADGLETA